MKRFLVLLLFFIGSTALFAQQTKSYQQFTSRFVLVDSITIDTKYSNGFKKESGTKLVYQYQDYIYEFMAGKYRQYDKRGNVITDSEFDNFGNYLSYKYSDSSGNIIEEFKINKINVNTNDVDDFMKDTWKFTDVFGYKKLYSYSYKLCVNYLKKEGGIKNLNKIGLWKIYDEKGNLKKEKIYR